MVTGHSLGGTAAALFAYDIYETSASRLASSAAARRPRLLTFGQPRLGDYAFSRALMARVSSAERVVHRHDIVPHVPFCVGAGDCYTGAGDPYHFGPEVWYTGSVSAGANYTECDGGGEDFNCSNSIFPAFSAADHCLYFGHICGGCCRLFP